MKLPGLKPNKKDSGVRLSHAFGASEQTPEEILGSTYAPPAGPSAAEKAGAVFSGLKERAAGIASQVHIPNLGRGQSSAEPPAGYAPEGYAPNGYTPDGFAPEGYGAPAGYGESPAAEASAQQPPADGWYNPFTDPDPPPSGYGYGRSGYVPPDYRTAYAPTYAPDYGYAPQPEYTPGYPAGYGPQGEYAYTAPPPETCAAPDTAYAPEMGYAPEEPRPAQEAPEADSQPIFNMNGEVIAYAPAYYDAAGNRLGYAQPCFDANGQLVGFAPPAVIRRAPEPAPKAKSEAPADLRFLLWAGSIVVAMVLTLVAFVYACAV